MTWRTFTERDCCEWKLNEVNPSDRDVWRSNVRSAASYLEESALMWMLLHLHINLNADDDDDKLGLKKIKAVFSEENYVPPTIFLCRLH